MIPHGLPSQFLNWKLVDVWHEKKQKFVSTKVPCLPDGHAVNAHDKSNWLDYETAKSYGRVAFVFDEDDDWFFLDLDKCGDASTGEWSSEATAIYTSFAGAWGEVSQSGKGLHIMGRCDKSRLLDRKNKWDGWLEFYIKERFIAFGDQGWSVIGGGEDTQRDWTTQLLKLVPERELLGDLQDGVDPSYTGPDDDDELIKLMLKSKNTKNKFGEGATAKDLWEGNDKVLSKVYLSDEDDSFDASKADMALMTILAFWTGKDMPRMDRLFRQSALMRDKFERKDYRTNTIKKACQLAKRVYDVVPKEDRPSSQDNPLNKEVFLSIPEMWEYFKGCVYVRDTHRVFVPDGAMLKKEQFDATYGGHWFQMLPDNTKPTRSAFEALTQNACYKFPQAKGTSFHPNLPPSTILPDDTVNIYVDPQVASVPGDPAPVWDLMCRQIPDERDRLILIYYLAAVVQYPGVKFQWCPVLQGCEGNGKTLWARCVFQAVGLEYSHVPKANNLSEKYNGFIENMIFICVEEIWMKGRIDVLNDLKDSITNERVEIRKMGVDKRMLNNNVSNWFMCTNHLDGVIKKKSDRRYSIFYTAQQDVDHLKRDGMDKEYFPNLYHWLKTGGYAIVTHWLKNIDIPDEFNPATACHRAPTTSSTNQALAVSMGPIEQEIMEASELGVAGFRDGWVSSKSLTDMLREKHIRMSNARLGTILTEMGYVKWGRASRPVMHQDNLRPMLWHKSDKQSPTFEQFLKTQGWRG